MLTILISGATGFLGSHLTRRFLADGHRVIGLVRSGSSLHRLTDIQDRLHLYNLEEVTLDAVFQTVEHVDAVLHTAVDYGRQLDALSHLVETNVLLGMHIAEAASRAHATCFIHAGSTLAPQVSPYALSKAQFSAWGKQLAAHHQLRFVEVVLEHMYGENDDESSFTSYLIINCLRNCARLSLTAGEQQRDFVYIEDVTAAFVRLVEFATGPDWSSNSGNYCAYPVGSGQAVTIRELAQTIRDATAAQTILDFGALAYRAHEVMYSQADISAMRTLGWAPRYSLPVGVQRTVNWYKAHSKESATCVG